MEPLVFQWRDGSRVTIPAQEAGDHLSALRERHGSLSADIVLKDAEDPFSPLHPAFEWDDSVAAREWRIGQARHLLNCIVIMRKGEDKPPIRAFVVVGSNDERRYEGLYVAMADTAMRQQVLQQAWRELQAFTEKYREFQELSAVFEAAAKVQRPRRRRAG